MIAIVLAAGKGERIRAVAGATPKPLIEINGNPVLIHNLRLLAKYGIKKVWINLHSGANAIRKAIGNGSKWGVKVRFFYEPKLLGTAGGTKNMARDLKGKDILVVCGDNYSDCDLGSMISQHTARNGAATIAVFDDRTNPNSGIAGGRLLVDNSGRVMRFVEGKAENAKWVNAGIYVLRSDFVKNIPHGFADFGKDVFPKAIARGENIYTYKMQGFCFGLDTPESYSRALARTAQLV